MQQAVWYGTGTLQATLGNAKRMQGREVVSGVRCVFRTGGKEFGALSKQETAAKGAEVYLKPKDESIELFERFPAETIQ